MGRCWLVECAGQVKWWGVGVGGGRGSVVGILQCNRQWQAATTAAAVNYHGNGASV